MKEPTAVDLVISELDPFDKSIRASEGEHRRPLGVRAHPGQAPRGQKQLPRGWRAEITERFGPGGVRDHAPDAAGRAVSDRPGSCGGVHRCGDSSPRLYREELTKSARKRTKIPLPGLIAKCDGQQVASGS